MMLTQGCQPRKFFTDILQTSYWQTNFYWYMFKGSPTHQYPQSHSALCCLTPVYPPTYPCQSCCPHPSMNSHLLVLYPPSPAAPSQLYRLFICPAWDLRMPGAAWPCLFSRWAATAGKWQPTRCSSITWLGGQWLWRLLWATKSDGELCAGSWVAFCSDTRYWHKVLRHKNNSALSIH